MVFFIDWTSGLFEATQAVPREGLDQILAASILLILLEGKGQYQLLALFLDSIHDTIYAGNKFTPRLEVSVRHRTTCSCLHLPVYSK